MIIYFFFLAIPLLAGLTLTRNTPLERIAFWFFFSLLLLFCGLRNEIGADWYAYHYLYETFSLMDYDELLDLSEPSYFVLCRLADSIGLGFPGVIFATSAIFLFGCFRYAQRTANPWIAVASVMPYLVFVISTSGVRQASAIGVGFYLMATWQRSSPLRRTLLVLLAVSFHNSAAVLLVFVIYGLKGSRMMRVALGAVLSVLVAFTLDTTEALDKYASVYVEQNVVSEGAFFHVLLIAFPGALYLFFRKRIQASGQWDRNVALASALTLLLMTLLPLSTTGIDRLTLYFSFVQMWAYPALLRAGVASRPLLKFGFSGVVLATFVVFFRFGAHASAYVPYKNILLD